MSARRIDGFANVLPTEQQNFPAQPPYDAPSDVPQNEDVIVSSDRLLPDFRVEMRRFALQQQVAPATEQTGSAVNNLRAGESIPIRIEANDTQSDVLRRAYTEYAQRAGLTSSGQVRFVEQMMRTGGETINHARTSVPFTDEDFAQRQAQGSINMQPTEEQVTVLRRMRVEELLSYGVTDWAVTESEERQVVDILRSDPNLSHTVRGLNESDYLGALLDRVDNSEQRRELITLLGSRLDAETARLVEPHVEALDVQQRLVSGGGGAIGERTEVSQNLWQVRFNLARLGLTQVAPPFNRAAYRDLINGNLSAPFTGAGATGVNPTSLDAPIVDGVSLWLDDNGYVNDPETRARYDNPNPNLTIPVSAEERRRQVELLVNQPISTAMPELYGAQPPSRADVIRAAATRYNLEPELVAAFILAESRDQSQLEDAKDYWSAVLLGQNRSIGLGQVVPSTVRRQDLFADLMSEQTRRNLTHSDTARLLASDEVNIFAVARYIRRVADLGANPQLRQEEISRATRENWVNRPAMDTNFTQRAVPGLDLRAYAQHSSTWSEANIRTLGSEYTSTPWDNVLSLEYNVVEGSRVYEHGRGWGDFVLDAYRDVKANRAFRR